MYVAALQGHIEELAVLRSVRINLIWWWVGFAASLIAAFLFVIGSVFFLPKNAAHIDTGCYMFVSGVLLFWATSAWSAWNYRSRHADASTEPDFFIKKVGIALAITFLRVVNFVNC